MRALGPAGVLVSVGGQTANNLVRGLVTEGIPIMGTPASAIDSAEDRGKFSALCDRLGIQQPLRANLFVCDGRGHSTDATAASGQAHCAK